MNQPAQHLARGGAVEIEGLAPAQNSASAAPSSPYLIATQLSPWSRSGGKRFFDCACVLLALPLAFPVFLVIALTVRLTSAGPVLFLQKRMGGHGRIFTIVKFRTMICARDKEHCAVTTAYNQSFTPVGSFLRRWKLDELPQLLNVFLGDMSLVGPRPKIPQHMISNLTCRPGITGAATIAFALEESVLERVPMHSLDAYYHTVVLPAKCRIDAEYMARATFLSDLKLIVDSVLRRWDSSIMEEQLHIEEVEAGRQVEVEDRMLFSRASIPEPVSVHVPMPPSLEQPAPAE